MAVAVAALGLAASITTFIEVGMKAAKRLKQFHSQVDDVLEAFPSVKDGLPLTIDTLERTVAQVEGGPLNPETTEALMPFVGGCLDQAKYLEERLDKLLPSKEDTGWDKTVNDDFIGRSSSNQCCRVWSESFRCRAIVEGLAETSQSESRAAAKSGQEQVRHLRALGGAD